MTNRTPENWTAIMTKATEQLERDGWEGPYLLPSAWMSKPRPTDEERATCTYGAWNPVAKKSVAACGSDRVRVLGDLLLAAFNDDLEHKRNTPGMRLMIAAILGPSTPN